MYVFRLEDMYIFIGFVLCRYVRFDLGKVFLNYENLGCLVYFFR